jgi:hypothetical protein
MGGGLALLLALTHLEVAHDIKEYADAGHGFLNAHDTDDPPVLLAVMVSLSAAEPTRCGTSYATPTSRSSRWETGASSASLRARRFRP